MCGRYSITTNVEALRRLFGFKGGPDLLPRFNLAPSQPAPVIRLSTAGARELALLKWGLIPAWAKDPAIGNRMINARAETLAEKPSFRAALKDRRCLVLADGFYEWQKQGSSKQPYFIKLADGSPFAMAGLWEHWSDRGSGEIIESFTIVTTAANEALQAIHERMPAILSPEAQEIWLAAKSMAAVQPLLKPFAGRMSTYPVTSFVNNPKNDSAACLSPAS
jgi:putative SOS response-associated peptidase YedK